MAEGRTEYLIHLPQPSLRPYVERYVGYRMSGFGSGIHRGMPSRHLTFIVSIGEPIDVLVQTDPHQPPARYGFVVSGLQASSALIAHNGEQHGVAFELTPFGCRALFGMPARALWNTSLEAAEVMGPAATELRERVAHASTWAGRFAACDEVLGRLAEARRPAHVEAPVDAAWRLLVASGGTLPVADVAAEVGWGRRHLSERFGDEFGLPPKLAARVIRFERARRLLEHPSRPAIADVAATCGYYDQPHLTRDFVELGGCPPAAWLEEEFPSVQDGEGMFPAESVA